MTEKKYLIHSSGNGEEQNTSAGIDISFKQIQGILGRKKRHVLVIFATSILIAALVFFFRTPAYTSQAMLMINEDAGQSKPLESLIGSEKESLDVGTTKDMMLITSMPVVEKLVTELYASNVKDSLECLGNREILTPLARQWRSATSSVLGSHQQPKSARKLLSPELRLRMDAQKLRRRISVDPVRNTNLLIVSVSSPDPDEAVYLTNTLCQTYKDFDIKTKAARYEQGKKAITEMMKEQEQKVEAANGALSNFMAANKIYDFSGNISQIFAKLAEIETKYNDAAVESRITRNNLNSLEPNLSTADKDLAARISKNIDVELERLLAEVKESESQYITLLRDKGEADLDVKAKRQELDVAKSRYQQLSRRKIASEIGYAGKVQQSKFSLTTEKLQNERSLNQINFTAGEYRRLKQYYEDQIKQLPPKQQEYAKLLRERDAVSSTYLALKTKLDETNIMLGSEVGRVSIAESAVYPLTMPEEHLPITLLVGSVFGLIFVTLYIGYTEVLDDSIKEELFFRSTGISTLSQIPYLSKKGNTLAEIKKKIDPNIPNADLPALRPKFTDALNSTFSESFRTLRTNLDYIGLHHQLKTILVSGTDAGEGKSVICANLGMAYALSGQKTLIVDCDLRRSSQHHIFNLKKEPGLTDYLVSSQSAIEDRYLQSTHLDNLFLLSAGCKVPNPNEILGSSRMIQLIEDLEGRFDRVLFDTTPLFFNDAAQLAKSTDGILLVARLLYSSKSGVKEYVENTVLKSHIIGVAIIDSPEESGSKSNRYTEKYNGYLEQDS